MDRILYFIKMAVPGPIFNILASPYHLLLSYLAVSFYGHPSRKMVVIGVVGTNGKSSVVEITNHILEEVGFKTASVSSLYFTILGERKKNILKMTMPGRFELQRFLRKAKNKGATCVLLEVTSEGIKQFRHKNIDWDILIFTNLSPEHIEAHGSFEKYKKTKEKVFADLSKAYRKENVSKVIIVNNDDEHAKDFLKYKANRKYIYGLGKEFVVGVEDSITPSFYAFSPSGIGFTFEGVDFQTKLMGKFNLYNILAAMACARLFGISLDKMKGAIEKIEIIPGRLEFIEREPFAVVVDYAHTPDALQKVYETLKNLIPKPSALNPRLICVLGAAGGGRDKWKRPEMGKIAAEFCDEIILTNEDPYDENPNSILTDIESGFSQIRNPKFEARKILDRREAIRAALKSAKQGDIVIITGKGAEPWIMGPHGTKTPWDDREVAREELERLG